MAALSAGERLCMLFVFWEGECTLSPSSGEQRGFAIAAPHVYSCAHFVTVKSGRSNKSVNTRGFLSTT